MPYNTEEIRHAYKSEHNLNSNQIIPLMITDGERWHYLTVKSLPELFRGIKSKHNKDFYCLNCFHSFRTENKRKKHENVCKCLKKTKIV